ncbi:ParB/RepB/Spo0J family partition protein [Enterobacteriaceae bacterium H11S18]|uniref:ParB/RepB/Spo0J family partition protein n=1 Tax=Dryocola clanedunensis TaxID=2925396 RepID=UPI0022F0F040|nr:ParB/RepB/Spo0J family partition protein [Dryocola clanedunensis]MCT4709201.1 ParB/RepB/Spo0J family partition protein [Dryocola clanedunensis]
MSVTESKAKSTKKSTTAKTAENEALKAALVSAPVEYVKLSRLVKSPLNVRSVPYAAEGVRELADSILAIGLLQNLVVHALEDGTYGVAAGGRRLTAMQLLVGCGSYIGNEEVAVQIIPEHLARAASLAENVQRCDMHPAEQIVAFRTLSEEGKTPARIGDVLGYGPRHVQRMLKLSQLAPAILDALAKDELTTEHCHALALENDPTRQVQVLEAARQSAWNGKIEPWKIRNLVTDNEVSTDSALFRFVGESAFADGDIRRDLFSENDGGYIDPVLLKTRALEKLQQEAENIRSTEGWAWCLHRFDSLNDYGEDAQLYVLQDEPEPVYTPEEETRLALLQAQYDEVVSQCEASDALELEMDAIENAAMSRAWEGEPKDNRGVVVSWEYGKPHVQRGVQHRQANDEEEAHTGSQVYTYTRTPEPVDDISLPLVTKMSSERTLAVQAALMQQPNKAVAMLVWTLCQKLFSSRSTDTLQINLTCSHYSLSNNAPSEKSGTAFLALMEEKKRLKALLPDGWEDDFTLFFTLSGELLMSLMAFSAACSVDGVQTREHGFTSRSRLDTLETALNFDLRDWWQPTKVGYFGQISKAQIVDALNDAGLTGAARDADKMKKMDAAELAESHMAANRWVPVWMKAPAAAPVTADEATDDTTGSDTQAAA